MSVAVKLYRDLELGDHQIKVLEKLNNGQVLWGGVGSGKSRVAVAYYIQREAPKDVYVITTARKRDELDWEEEFQRAHVGSRKGPMGPGFASLKRVRAKKSAVVSEEAHARDALSESERIGGGVSPSSSEGIPSCDRCGKRRSGTGLVADNLPFPSSSGVPFGEDFAVRRKNVATVVSGSGETGGDSGGNGGTHRSDKLSSYDAGGSDVEHQSGVDAFGGDNSVQARSSLADDHLQADRPVDTRQCNNESGRGGSGGENLGARSRRGNVHLRGARPASQEVSGQDEIHDQRTVVHDVARELHRSLVSSGIRSDGDRGSSLDGNPSESLLGGSGAGGEGHSECVCDQNAVVERLTEQNAGASLVQRADAGMGGGELPRGFEAGQYPWVLTVDSWQNISKYADVSGAFFIFDEQRLVGSGDWTRKFLRIAKRNTWIMLSATPGDTWMDYVPLFVANNFYKNRTEFKREHVVYNTFTKFPKVDRYINVGRLMRQRNELLVEMPFKRHTTRHQVEVPLQYDKEALELVLKKRWNIYEDRPLRDVAEMFAVGRRLINSHPSRLEMVKDLWTIHPKLIVFYNYDYELDILRSLTDGITSQNQIPGPSSIPTTNQPQSSFSTSGIILPSKSPKKTLSSPISALSTGSSKKWSGDSKSITRTSSKHILVNSTIKINFGIEKEKDSLQPASSTTSIAEWNGHKHQPVPDTSRWIYLVQYTAGAEAWNCITTDAMIRYSRNYSWRITEQSEGRIDRLNTPFKDLWYYDFTTDSFIDLAIGRSLKAKETFNEAKYARMFVG